MVYSIAHDVWEFRIGRGLSLDPKSQGSWYKDTHKKTPLIYKNSHILVAECQSFGFMFVESYFDYQVIR